MHININSAALISSVHPVVLAYSPVRPSPGGSKEVLRVTSASSMDHTLRPGRDQKRRRIDPNFPMGELADLSDGQAVDVNSSINASDVKAEGSTEVLINYCVMECE